MMTKSMVGEAQLEWSCGTFVSNVPV